MRCLLLLTLVVLVAQARAGTVYAMVTEFSKNISETVQYTIAVSVNSGKYINVVKNFEIAGSSLTFDGISTFNDDKGIFYYAPNWPAPFVFSADVKKGELKAPLYMGGTEIARVDFDDATKTLYTLLLVDKKDKVSGYLISTGPDGTALIVLTFPPEFDFDSVIATEVYNNQFWMVTTYHMTQNTTEYALSAFNLTDPASPPIVAAVTGCKSSYINYIAFDQDSGTFYGAAAAEKGNTMVWYLWNLANDGTCTETKIPLPDGIATCFTYDQKLHVLWLAYAQNGGNYLYGFNAPNKVMYKSILLADGLVPAALEYSQTDF